MKDPSVETWRAALGPFPIRLREPRNTTDEASELTRLLLETRQALAASQADLTRMEAERNAMARTIDRLHAERQTVEAEAAHWRDTAGRHLANLDETARALATANHRNRILTAENEAALRRLNEAAEQAEKLRGYWQECSRHRDQILADRAQCPIPEEKP